jgi:hypothetical protein
MPHVDFSKLRTGSRYTRDRLATLWGYASFHAIARGVVTPAGDNKIVLFVTEDKAADRTQYRDRLRAGVLEWEGPTDHFAEDRMLAAPHSGDQIHVFYRRHQRDSFEYLGQCSVAKCRQHSTRPSEFELKIM